MKIFVTGTRGVPDIPGGVEQHCQQLYPLIAAAGHEVHISRRTPYVTDNLKNWQGIHLHDIYAPRSKALEAIIHTFLSVIKARLINADVIHIHAVGPAMLIPFAKLLGMRVVFTNHGPDYDRQKWGRFSRQVLMLGEYLGGRFSSVNIVISEVIRQIILNRCKRQSHIIYNGVNIQDRSENTDFLDKIGVRKNEYILAVARFVPEKGLHDLIDAWSGSGLSCDLVIAGDADHEDDYSRSLKKKAEQCGVKLTGYIGGNNLRQVFSHASLFVLPSYHEGLPIALLEALSYGLNVLVSDIPANLEVELDPGHFFRCGDVADLQAGLEALLSTGAGEDYQQYISNLLHTKYNWLKIAQETIDVYKTTIKTRK